VFYRRKTFLEELVLALRLFEMGLRVKMENFYELSKLFLEASKMNILTVQHDCFAAVRPLSQAWNPIASVT
jgi:hypothetical protein